MHKTDEFSAEKDGGRPPRRRRFALLLAVALTAMASVVGLAPGSPASAAGPIASYNQLPMGNWGAFGNTNYYKRQKPNTVYTGWHNQKAQGILCQEWDLYVDMDAAYASNPNYNFSFIIDMGGGDYDYFACWGWETVP